MKSKIIFLFLFAALLVTCKKSPDPPTGDSKPEITTTQMDTIKATWAIASSSINTLGFEQITDHGFCWGVTPLPDLTAYSSSQGGVSSTGSFSFYLSGLTSQTTYYIRAYAKTNKTFFYGAQQEFTTLELMLPSVNTSDITKIFSTTARCGGNVTGDGNGIVSARGVCWNTTGDPVLTNCLGNTVDGSGTGSFTSQVEGLTQEMTYYIAAYATNEKGTAYGTQKTFTTPLPCGQLTVTYEGRIYNTVLIGDQCWFKENLNVGTRIDGSQNQDPGNPTIEKYCFDNDEANCTAFGGLYQWDELMKNSTTPGSQGICPDDWHIPSNEEWTALTDILGGESVAGTKLKSTTGWFNNGNGTNISGFTGFPTGNRGNDGTFNDLTKLAYFWSSTQAGASESWNRKLHFDTESVTKYNSFNTNGFAVRCLQDD